MGHLADCGLVTPVAGPERRFTLETGGYVTPGIVSGRWVTLETVEF